MGLNRETELASLRAIAAAGGIPTFLGAHAVPPEFEQADEYVDWLIADVLPEAATIAEAADVFLERGAFDAVQARRYLEAARGHGLELRLHGDQFTEAGAIPLAIELGARSVDHLEATGRDGVRALAESDVVGVLLPASALFLGRPMPPARALVERGRGASRSPPTSTPAARSARACRSSARSRVRSSGFRPLRRSTACTVNAAHVLGRADSKGRLAPGFDADIVLLDAPDWRYLAYHLGGDVVSEVIVGGTALG